MKIYSQRLDDTDLTPKQRSLIEEQKQNNHYLYLDFDTRQRSRFKANTVLNESVAIDLPRTETLKDGCVLSTADGELIQVKAAKQTLVCVTADDGFNLMKGAYHLGNRHVPLMITPSALYFEPDHVLESMLQNIGLHTEQVQAPFEPETGAYKGGHGHSHSSHSHDHASTHSHEKEHSHD